MYEEEVTLSSMRPFPESPLVVSLGMGVDSIAMLLGMYRRGIRPDAILFADTGSEKPKTIEAIPVVEAWLERAGFPTITVVRKVPPRAPYRSLWGYCAAGDTLPSLAFTGGPMGAGQCSTAWKIEPQLAWLKAWKPAQLAWALGGVVVTAVGYDAGPADAVRCAKSTGKNYSEGTHKWFPLVEWGWTREVCEAVIRTELGDAFEEAIGQTTPVKSACFMCPAMTREEVVELADTNWDLALRAIAIEYRALHGRIKFARPGLGISWNWLDLLRAHDKLPCDWREQAVAKGYIPAGWDAYVAKVNAERPMDERKLAKAEEKAHKIGRRVHGPRYRFDPELKARMKRERVAWLTKTKTVDRGLVPEPEDNVENGLGIGFTQIGKARSFQAARVGQRLPLAAAS